MSEVVANLLNLSFAAGKVYANWKLAVFTPIPKIPKPKTFSNSRQFLLLQFCHASLRDC